MRLVREKFSREQQREPLARLVDELVDVVVMRAVARMETRPTQRLLDVKDTAKYLGRTDAAVREMERSGKLKRVSKDGRVMFDRHDLDAWIEASKE